METVDCPPGSLANIGIEDHQDLLSRHPVATPWCYALRDHIFKSPERERTTTNIIWVPEK